MLAYVTATLPSLPAAAAAVLEISVEPRGVRPRLAEDPAEQRTAPFGDMAEAILSGEALSRMGLKTGQQLASEPTPTTRLCSGWQSGLSFRFEVTSADRARLHTPDNERVRPLLQLRLASPQGQ
jgi:hypothetical protein